MKRIWEDCTDKMLAFGMIWIILSVAYFTYAYFYRIHIVMAIIVVILYGIISYQLLRSFSEQNKKILLTCTLVIAVVINMMSMVYWGIEEIQNKAYHQYLEEKPENILLKNHVEETP